MIPVTSISLNVNGSWTFSWTSTGASYYRVVLEGKELSRVTVTSYIYNGQDYRLFPPPLEIMPEAELSSSEKFLPFFIIQWYRDEGAASYLVQALVGSVWTKVVTVVESGQWVYSYQTPVLMDENVYSYSVIAQDDLGNQAPARTYIRYVVCPPIPPDPNIKVSYSAANILVAFKA